MRMSTTTARSHGRGPRCAHAFAFAFAPILALALALVLPACADPLAPAGPRRLDAGSASARPIETDLPCGIAATLAAHCWTCHGSAPTPGTPTSLVSRADLAAPSAVDPVASYGERAVARMRALSMPMPPIGAPVPEPEIAALETWIAAGMPADRCTLEDPWATPIQCSSGRVWSGGNDESPEMRPGGGCVGCHAAEAPEKRFFAAGTVYATAHEPDDCDGADTGGRARVELTDATGRVFVIVPNAAGNFFLEPTSREDLQPGGARADALVLPYTARVVLDGRERSMLAAQTSGDCNACHTLEGASGAPGRIVLP
jgi:mono/diheme cytochrome c family protein